MIGAGDITPLRVEFVGTGNAYGIPAFGCECRICNEAAINLEKRRIPPCTMVTTAHGALMIDAGDLALCKNIARFHVRAILISHFHAGHLYGLLSLPAGGGCPDIYCPPDYGDYTRLQSPGSDLNFSQLAPNQPVEIGPFEVTPVLLNHGVITYGYCVAYEGCRVAYLNDTCGLPPQTEEFIANWRPDTLVIDCNQPPERPRPNHNTPHQAFEIFRRSGAGSAYLTHISCDASAWLEENPTQLPPGVEVAYDGMVAPVHPSAKTHPQETEPGIDRGEDPQRMARGA